MFHALFPLCAFNENASIRNCLCLCVLALSLNKVSKVTVGHSPILTVSAIPWPPSKLDRGRAQREGSGGRSGGGGGGQ